MGNTTDNAKQSQGFTPYRVFQINKEEIPNKFFRITAKQFYLVYNQELKQNEIVQAKTVFTISKKVKNLFSRYVIFFTETERSEIETSKIVKNKGLKFKDLTNIKIDVINVSSDGEVNKFFRNYYLAHQL